MFANIVKYYYITKSIHKNNKEIFGMYSEHAEMVGELCKQLLCVVRIVARRASSAILHEYTVQQIFILGYPVFCLIIEKLIIRINSKGNPVLIKLLRHE